MLLLLAFVEIIAWPHGISFMNLPALAIGWFSVGLFVASRKLEYRRMPLLFVSVAGLIWIGAALLYAAQAAGIQGLCSIRHSSLKKAIAISGIICCWGSYDYFKIDQLRYPEWFKETFFIYVFHGPVVAWIIAIGLYALGKNSMTTLVVTLCAPILTLGMCGIAVLLMKRYCGKAYAFLIGGRTG